MKYLRSLAGMLSVVANNMRAHRSKPVTAQQRCKRKRIQKLQRQARQQTRRQARGLQA